MTKKELEDTADTEDTESEDTSEEESSEEEDTEDTEESSEEGEESEETEEEESTEEDSSEQIIDLKKVPPQLREIAKRMQASHTKAMQKVKSQFEGWKTSTEKELQEAYSAAIVKAKGFDQLTKLAQFQTFWADMEAGRPYGYSSDFRKNTKSKSEDDSSTDSEGKVDVESLMKQLTPVITKVVEDAVGPLRSVHISNQWKSAEENLPNFTKYKARITALISEHPTLSLEQAYKLAAPDEEVSKKVSEALKKAKEDSKKVPRTTLKPGSSGIKTLTTETVDDIGSAIRLASKKLLGAVGG